MFRFFLILWVFFGGALPPHPNSLFKGRFLLDRRTKGTSSPGPFSFRDAAGWERWMVLGHASLEKGSSEPLSPGPFPRARRKGSPDRYRPSLKGGCALRPYECGRKSRVVEKRPWYGDWGGGMFAYSPITRW
jgi:hypothetical protein